MPELFGRFKTQKRSIHCPTQKEGREGGRDGEKEIERDDGRTDLTEPRAGFCAEIRQKK